MRSGKLKPAGKTLNENARERRDASGPVGTSSCSSGLGSEGHGLNIPVQRMRMSRSSSLPCGTKTPSEVVTFSHQDRTTF
jgi:hypothetical protein